MNSKAMDDYVGCLIRNKNVVVSYKVVYMHEKQKHRKQAKMFMVKV